MQIEELAIGLYKTIIKHTAQKIEKHPFVLIQELYDQYEDGNAIRYIIKQSSRVQQQKETWPSLLPVKN